MREEFDIELPAGMPWRNCPNLCPFDLTLRLIRVHDLDGRTLHLRRTYVVRQVTLPNTRTPFWTYAEAPHYVRGTLVREPRFLSSKWMIRRSFKSSSGNISRSDSPWDHALALSCVAAIVEP